MLTKEILVDLKLKNPNEYKKEVFKEFYKCSNDGKYTIETYFTVMAGTTRIPFKMFPHQHETFEAYEEYTNNLSMKTRQMGFTTFTSAYIAWILCTKNNYKVCLISKTMRDSKDFLKNIKDILDEARKDYPWLVPDYAKGYNNKESFMLVNGSLVVAQSTSEDAGRGVPGMCLLCVDEAAFIDRRTPGKMDEIFSAASPALGATQGKTIIISTPKGSSGWYFETYMNAKQKGFHIIEAHWTVHPNYSKGQYQWKIDVSLPEGGYIHFFEKEWPEKIFDKESGGYIELKKEEYNFICDGRIRSPWYDFESAKIGPHRTKCELDCSFAGTGGEVLDSDTLRLMKSYADKQKYTNPFESIKGNTFKNYREYIPFIPGDHYVIASDVCTGDGSDYSTALVFNVTKYQIHATYKEQIIPKVLKEVLTKIGKRFGNSLVLVENQGGGFTTLQELKDSNYAHIYYTTLNKKDPSTGMKKRKIGLWASEEVRMQGGDKLEEAIRMEQIVIPCEMLVAEFNTWIWDKDGKRRHAPQKHDDLIIALQHSIWYARYVYKRQMSNKEKFKKMFMKTDGQNKFKISSETEGKTPIVISNKKFSPKIKTSKNPLNIEKEIPPELRYNAGKRNYI